MTRDMEMPATPDAMLAYVRSRSLDRSPFAKLLGIELVECWNGRARLRLAVRSDLLQHRGTVHGGVIGTVVDNVAGWAAGSLLGPLVTTSYSVHFLAPAKGPVVTAEANVRHAGGKTAVVTVEVFAETGQDCLLVAIASATVRRIIT